MTNCHGEATTQVDAQFARHGPFGTAARFSADPSDKTKLTVTFTISGICRTVSRTYLGGAEPDARFRRLPAPLKRVASGERCDHAKDKQKRANLSARIVKRAPRIRRSLAGLTLAIIGTGGISVVTMTNCHGEATTQVDAKFARHGPFGTAARFSAPSDGSGLPTGPARRVFNASQSCSQIFKSRSFLAGNLPQR